MLLFPFLWLQARYDGEPFEDVSQANPSEGLRIVSRLMHRLSRNRGLSPEQIEKLQKEVEDRLTRVILALEKKQASSSSGSGQGLGKKQKPRNSGETGNPSSTPGSQAHNREKKISSLKKKKKKYRDKRPWGHLPPREREALETNLSRDVPQEIEQDMKDFQKRMEELE
jgi:hypothetical protein